MKALEMLGALACKNRSCLASFYTAFPFLLFIVSMTVYLRLAIILLGGPDFNDETEKLVGGMMIHDGMRLYKDMFDHHGPFSYILAHLFYTVTGSRDVAHYRLIPLMFSLFSITSILSTPAIKNLHARLIGASLMALGLAATQAIYGLMLGMYQIYAGHLLVCALALLIIPVLLDRPVPRIAAFLGGLALGFVFFSAYSFVVACAFLSLIVLYKAWLEKDRIGSFGNVKNAALGLLVSVLIVFLWLLVFGDVIGYFVYHIYFNQIVYAKFSDYRPFAVLHLVLPMVGYWTLYNSPPAYLLTYVISSSVSCFSLLLLFLKFRDIKNNRWKLASVFGLLLLGIIFTNPRAMDDFQADTLVIVAIGFAALAFSVFLDQRLSWRSPLMLASGAMMGTLVISFSVAQFLAITYLYRVPVREYYHMRGILKKSEFSGMQFLRGIVAPDEPVQQFPYDLWFYIAMDRKPASGNYYYLPWQDAYFKNPLWNYRIDVCREMETKLPKVIHYSRSVIWVYPTSGYLGCVEKLLDTRYVRTTRVENVWIRADIAASREDVLNSSIVPETFDASWLPEEARKKINEAKIHFKKLSTVSGDMCLQKPKKDHDPLEVGNCANENTLQVGMRSTARGQELISAVDLSCVEVTGASTDDQAPLRLWPCQGIANQTLSVLLASSGFHLRVAHSNKCLSINVASIVQTSCDNATKWQWK